MNIYTRYLYFIVWLICAYISLSVLYINTRTDYTNRSMHQTPANNQRLDQESKGQNCIGKTKDVDDLIKKIQIARSDFFPNRYWTISMDELARSLSEVRRKTGAAVLHFQRSDEYDWARNVGTWAKVDRNIRQYSLYDPDDDTLDTLLEDMKTLQIEQTRVNPGGTQLKLNIKFKGGGRALLKAKRIFGYYRVPPTVGRVINITSELVPLLPATVRETVHRSAVGKVCFYGHCKFACEKTYSFCGSPDEIEVSLMYLLPNATQTGGKLDSWQNSWKVSQEGSKWKTHAHVCNQTKQEYTKGNTLLFELLDVHYFDSLIDNIDRHHYAMYDGFKNDTIPILFDNGRSFGDPRSDYLLHFWYHDGCCLMKKTTFLKFLKLFVGPEKLSKLLRDSLRSDPVNPVLVEEQLKALDRRVNKTILYIKRCLEDNSHDSVIIDDIMT